MASEFRSPSWTRYLILISRPNTKAVCTAEQDWVYLSSISTFRITSAALKLGARLTRGPVLLFLFPLESLPRDWWSKPPRMRISEVRIHPITLPFAQHFSHSQKKDMSADNILLEIVGEDGGLRGYGEGAPRLYVTGESQASAVKTAYNLVRRESFP